MAVTDWLLGVLGPLGAAVDKAVPVAVGNRTKIAVILCPVLKLAVTYAPMFPQSAPFVPLAMVLENLLCAAAPAFALAGLVRDANGNVSTTGTPPVPGQ